MVCKEKSLKKTLPHWVSLDSFERFHVVDLFMTNGKMNEHETTNLVDNGCTRNFIVEEYAKKVNLRTQEAPYSYEV